ncbi:protein ENHANCED DOWNY MILDEW 2-like isoform X1 [Quercus lobata]|uniref:Zinc finger PHD-type domain-containing protein n=1 Tax=Quercus lobata TaxID=97700 RepID=A0A7N2MAE4_QUELO|nr:protein ENHANCED DOWNY MILDEW 2-like isoform X1 [Quercus lobata]
MASDEESEIVAEFVTNYDFIDHMGNPVSLSVLPLQWSEGDFFGDLETQVFVRGDGDDGLQRIYKCVIAWKFQLSYVRPEICVLSKEKSWITLQKPRKAFENTIRTILVTVQWLHFVKKNPEASEKSLWNHLMKTFSSFEVEPSENDLLDHIQLITEAAKRDEPLVKSKYLLTFLEKPRRSNAFHEDAQKRKKLNFIVYSDDEEEYDKVFGEEDNELYLYDYVCSICDNGGEILCCEGKCLRSFHANIGSGAEDFCETLGYTDAQVKAMPIFLCRNCKYQQHQCFVCGKLGFSDKSSDAKPAEVFPCVSATCGHFYHPECVAKLLHPHQDMQALKLQKKIAAGESFTCPAHKCFVCKQGENKNVHELQFALCRRCPKAYHRKCLPWRICFEYNNDEDILQRAWDGLLPNRILIYCLDHEINKELGTPLRDHLKFPDAKGIKRQHEGEKLSSKKKAVASRKGMVCDNLSAGKIILKLPNRVKKMCNSVEGGDSTKKIKKRCFRQDFDSLKKKNTIDLVGKSVKENIRSIPCKSFTVVGSKSSTKSNKSLIDLELYPLRSKKQKLSSGKIKNTILEESVMIKSNSSEFVLNAETKNRILALMKNSTTSFNNEEFIRRQKVQGADAYYGSLSDKSITQGKVECSVKAIQTALQRLEEGYSIEDAKAVCEPEILWQIFKWKRKLGVYLAPFLYGTRYTSFGRHFTKVNKLKEIVNRLHYYVQNGDMIVDFCCGSNDFSCLMKEKLEKTGKGCTFKNYDLFQAKNDFSFEKRDWMSVNPEELPNGSQLIMGLNPPFGIKASLANKFINKALEFKPKLLILIVPKETRRLDKNNAAYDLIWEDHEVLSGKSFYLPGSVDVHDKTLEDWNLKPPPLYLWSRRDWTARHKAIAQEHGHIFKEQPEMCLEGKNAQNYLIENCGFFWDHTGLHPPGDMGNWHGSSSGTNLGNRYL